jgi:hypothetical protein
MKSSPIAILTASYISVAAVAAPENTNGSEFGASVFLSSQHTDNALKSNDNKISELQNQLGAAVFSDYENDYLALNADYSVSEMRYEKDSQKTRTTTIGRTDFVLGKPHNAFDLKVSHSIQKLPKFSGALDLEENNDEKQILSVQPGFHKRITAVDNLFINANATEVDYRFEEHKNSSRRGGTLGVIHNFSAVDSLTIYASTTDVEFEYSPDVDYSQTMAVIAFESRLRKLGYRLEVGQSRTDSSMTGISEDPYYSLAINYDADFHQIGVRLNQLVTDSSRGFDAGVIAGDYDLGNDITAEQVDQVLLRHVDVRWESNALCSRCNFYISAYRDQHEFLSSDREEERIGAALGFAYRLSPKARIGINASRVEQEQENETNNSEYTLEQLTAYYRYSFVNGLDLRLSVAEHERSAANENEEYTELRAGITVSYRF